MDLLLEIRKYRADMWNKAKAFLAEHLDENGNVSDENLRIYAEMENEVSVIGNVIDYLVKLMRKNEDDTRCNDPVNHPSHYTTGRIECIEFITDKQLNFCRGNAVKYIVRAGKKDPDKEIEDLEKAAWYLNREIADLKKEREGA